MATILKNAKEIKKNPYISVEKAIKELKVSNVNTTQKKSVKKTK